MVFSSIVFLLYFLPIFLITYYAVPEKYKNIVILFFSIFFYSWGAPKFIFVILGTTFLDFHLVRWMWHTQNQIHRRLLLTLSVSVNFGLLFYFKYSNFFIENINSLLSIFGNSNIQWTKLILPIGISFYTFETITYVVDVYRRVHKPLEKFWDYQLYIILFPKLIAGPIVRFHEIADQIEFRDHTMDKLFKGGVRFIFGLSKKVLIANVLSGYADSIFNGDISSINSTEAWLAIVAYTFQIYFDFSGYSDMALGIGQMLGFKFPENFNSPYISKSITEFWRRWHITLGNWMRNYLYIPLGGNRVNTKFRLYFNLILVFFFSGLWHGASWNFIIWGLYHGIFLVLDRIFLLKLLNKLYTPISVVFTFFVVVFGWVIFRIENLTDTLFFYKKLVDFNFSPINISDKLDFIFMLLIGIIISFITLFKFGNKLENMIFSSEYNAKLKTVLFLSSLLLFTLCIGSLTVSKFNPFIYFRF
jgi:alginate O-acetyltransferase complex protein AlgI